MASSQSSRLDKTIKAAISPDQSRTARGLLDISHRELAKAAGGSLKAVKDFESGARTPRPATQDTLEKAGVELIPQNCGGQGVRWRYSEQTTTVSHETSRRPQASCTN
jgi:ribosome-binding protein aMBF1 (putative translation factor)